MKTTRYIFVTGGIMSSLGKGIAAASIGALLQSRGWSVKIKKMDPYINFDPGTMSPYRHGEVFVMSDGGETDLDFGHYERFTGIECTKNDTITTGKIYTDVLNRERKGEYLGSDIQVVPHITDEIKKFITADEGKADFVVCEVGGTVGDIEGLPYIEAIRQLTQEMTKSLVLLVHLTYIITIRISGEQKTKPTQNSVQQMRSLGLSPDILLCRTESPMEDESKKKLQTFCGVKYENVIEALDTDNIYKIPTQYHESGLDKQICEHFGIRTTKSDEEAIKTKWGSLCSKIASTRGSVDIAIVGKYTKLKDAYISLNQAIIHTGMHLGTQININWIDADNDDVIPQLRGMKAIIVPGGFGARGYLNKVNAIKYSRENKVPYLGICLGMQLAVIESCRNICGVDANSSEFSETGEFVVDFLDTWVNKDGKVEIRKVSDNKGGTMRLGAHVCNIKPGTLASRVFGGSDKIVERYRHRYEVNIAKYSDLFEKAGIVFSGMSEDGTLPKIMERQDHPYFIGTQSHPELISSPFNPHPLFVELIKAGIAL